MRSEAFEHYVASARARPQLWRLAAGLALVVAVHVALSLLLIAGMDRAGQAPLTRAASDSPAVMLLLMGSFAGLALGTLLAARLLHGRGPSSLLGPARRAGRDFVLGLAVVGGVQAAALALAAPAMDLQPQLPPTLWLVWLGPALAVILLQTGAEEVLFRGYLQQQLAARFSSALVWMLLPSLAFGMLHYDPAQMGDNAWAVVAATGLFGLIAADLTARSGSLGLAWGLHFANNVLALTVVAAQGDLAGLALFTTAFAPDAAAMRWYLALDMALLLAIWAICRRALHRR